jgi:RNA polymerase sigma-70 factor (ECF subfamily)
LRAFVGRRVPARDSDDVTQDVLLRMHQGLESLRDASRAESWAYGIARRAIADYYRARKPGDEPATGDEVEHMPAVEPNEPRGFGGFEGDHSVHEEVLSWLRPTAEKLPAKYREALLLADFEGVTQIEVADRLGLSLSGAKSRVQRARGLLADALRRCCEIAMSPDGEVVDFRRQPQSSDCGCDSDG